MSPCGRRKAAGGRKSLAERGVHTVIAAAMGQRAQAIFAQHDVAVVVGAPPAEPEAVVADYLAGTLQTGTHLCDH